MSVSSNGRKFSLKIKFIPSPIAWRILEGPAYSEPILGSETWALRKCFNLGSPNNLWVGLLLTQFYNSNLFICVDGFTIFSENPLYWYILGPVKKRRRYILGLKWPAGVDKKVISCNLQKKFGPKPQGYKLDSMSFSRFKIHAKQNPRVTGAKHAKLDLLCALDLAAMRSKCRPGDQ